MSYSHLHAHSEYSLKDAVCRINELPAKAASLGMTALALTDHGTMAGVKKFVDSCKRNNIKYILGMEAYMSPESRLKKAKDDKGLVSFHLLLLAQNLEGYKNLIRLSSEAYTSGFYYKPRIDYELLAQHSNGLICTTACVGGPILKLIDAHGIEKIRTWVQDMKSILPGRFFLEVQNNGIEAQTRLNSYVQTLAREFDLPIVGTNDVHYIEANDWELQHTSVCIGHAATLDNPTYPKQNLQLYLKSPDEMAITLANLPEEAITNTDYITSLCDGTYFDQIKGHMPKFPGLKEPAYDILRKIAGWGLYEKFKKQGLTIPKVYKDRLNYELSIIKDMNYADYFLMIWDIINHANDCGIMTGPGRGSAAGSAVCWALNITKPDPLKAGLFFERFLNPDRISLPDVDSDFDPQRLSDIYKYITDKYGQDHVARIGTYGHFAGKSAVRDLARVYGHPPYVGNEIAGRIPDPIYGKNKSMKDIVAEDLTLVQDYPDIIRDTVKLDGMIKQSGLHACGVIISTEPIRQFAPIYIRKDDDIGLPITQWTHDDLEKIGLVKFDLLSIDNLTIIAEALRLIKETRGLVIDLDTIPEDNQAAFTLIKSGELDGIFQLEASSGMKGLVTKVQPKSLDELSDILALYRPGPIEAGHIAKYIENRESPTPPVGLHPKLVEVLRSTHFVPIYQEQMMKLAQVLAGYSLAESDLLRHAIGKKKKEEMDKHYDKFIQGLIKYSQFSEYEAEQLWCELEGWAAYGFNKSHSYSYAVLAYRTAYLKANYPVEFICALLATRCGSDRERMGNYLKNARSRGIDIVGVCINTSQEKFALGPDNTSVVFGLGGLKGIGSAASQAIINARGSIPFKDLDDFMSRVDCRVVDKIVLKALIAGGAFDCLSLDRQDLLNKAETVHTYYKDLRAYYQKLADYQEREAAIKVFIGLNGEQAKGKPRKKKEPIIPDKPELKKITGKLTLALLNEEYQITGLFLSGNPADYVKVEGGAAATVEEFESAEIGAKGDMVLIFPKTEPLWQKGDRSILLAQDIKGDTLSVLMSTVRLHKLHTDNGLAIGLASVIKEKTDRESLRVRVKDLEIVYKS